MNNQIREINCVLSFEEYQLLRAYRKANFRYKMLALTVLTDAPTDNQPKIIKNFIKYSTDYYDPDCGYEEDPFQPDDD